MNAIKWIESTARDPLTDKPVKLLSWQKSVLENMYDDNCNVLKPHLFIGFTKKIGKFRFRSNDPSLSHAT